MNQRLKHSPMSVCKSCPSVHAVVGPNPRMCRAPSHIKDREKSINLGSCRLCEQNMEAGHGSSRKEHEASADVGFS